MISISKEKIIDYCMATGKKKSYKWEDYERCKNLSINEFIYISDNLDKFKDIIKEIEKKE